MKDPRDKLLSLSGAHRSSFDTVRPVAKDTNLKRKLCTFFLMSRRRYDEMWEFTLREINF